MPKHLLVALTLAVFSLISPVQAQSAPESQSSLDSTVGLTSRSFAGGIEVKIGGRWQPLAQVSSQKMVGAELRVIPGGRDEVWFVAPSFDHAKCYEVYTYSGGKRRSWVINGRPLVMEQEQTVRFPAL